MREALGNGDLLAFESTGAARTSVPVANEPWRKTGFLNFAQATAAAKKMILEGNLTLDFVLDVQAARQVDA